MNIMRGSRFGRISVNVSERFAWMGRVALTGLLVALLVVLASTNHAVAKARQAQIGGVNLGDLTDYLFFFGDARSDANWQGATKGFVGDVAVDGLQADERTSGGVPFAGTIYTNDSTLAAWASIVDQNDPAQVSPAQAFASTGQTALIANLETTLNNAFTQINALSVSASYGGFGFNGVSSTSLDGLDTTDGVCQTFVANITSGLQVSSQIDITGDACDVFVMRWDSDANFSDGYEGQVKFQSGGAIVPHGGLKPSNFIHVAGDINSSGGGSNPAAPYPQGPRLNDGTGALCTDCANFNGGGFFTGYWLTTGSPDNPADATHSVPYGDSSSLSNGIFVGGWYSINTQFSMTSGTSGVYVSPNPATNPSLDYGDAPDTGAGAAQGNYNTLATDSGPSHTIVANLRLGTIAPDADSGTLQNTNADADDANNTDDEDGTATLPTVTTTSTSIPLSAGVFNNTGASSTLACWIDFNRDGDFTDTGERAATTVNTSASQQTANLTFTGFATPTAGTTYLRCRLASAAGEVANPTGAAASGEVEDYLVTVVQSNGAIGDFVWFDSDQDGIQDVAEPGLANVTLDLYRNGLVVASTQTDADGGYLFPGLSAGAYVVDVTDLNGVLAGLIHVVANQSQTDPSMTINLGAGEVYKDADFGYYEGSPNPLIGDTVWYDGNGDGVQQPNEPGIPGVQVCATPTAGGAATCKTTNSNGNYWLLVTAGTYNVAPVNPPAGYTPTTPTARTVTVADFDRYLDADFGYNSPALGQIGNLVFEDKNKDGIFNGSDTPIGGVSVSLIQDSDNDGVWDSGEPIIATTTSATALSGSTGNYLFTGVPQGNYLVHVSDTNSVLADYVKSFLGTLGSDGHNQPDPYRVVLGAGASNLTADFGYYRSLGPNTGVIGNQVWTEIDGNGLFDPTSKDVGQAGVTVELNKDGVYYATTTTGASGDYSFTSLPAGSYSVSVTDDYAVLAAYAVTLLGPTPASDNNNQQQPYAITLAEGGYNLTADFGYVQKGVIGDYVWYDTDSDGVQDLFEPGIGNVTLDAYRSGVKVATTTTGADGGYIFTDLLPGSYTVDVTDGNGALAGLTHTSGPQSQPDPTGVIVIGPGDIYRDADFGYVKESPGQAILGDLVWYDGDGDGIPDPGEPGIGAVVVCATPVGGGAAICATTNSAGVYLITVPPGSYNVSVTNPPAGYTTTTVDPHGPVTLAAGQQYLNADFGYDSPNLASLGGTVWRDTNNDGALAVNEPTIPSVSVDLIRDSNGNGLWDSGEPVIATDTSNQDGDYLFVGLPAANYLLRVSDTQNVLDDSKVTIPGANPGQDNNNQTQPYAVALAAGQTNTTGDFGYVPVGNLGTIGNQLWYEADGNGIYNPQAGDVGVAGVTVALYRNALAYATTTTGASGDYVFTSLPAGNYTVTVTDQFGVLTSYILTAYGPTPGQDNHHQAQPYAIGLAAAGVNMTADFGYTRPGAIGDFVWYDADSDGVQDVGEPGIPNVTLDLYRNGAKIATTISDADGGYLFSGLRPGVYSVDVTDVNGRLAGLTHIIANQSQADPTMSINLGAGEVYKDADFGYVNTTSGSVLLGDFVWYDANGDGFQQPNEPGIAGVTVQAIDGSGTTYTQITNNNGYYLFELPPAAYTVTPLNPPAGLTPSTPTSLGPRVMLNGDIYLKADFGYTDGTGSLLGVIGNLVFADKDKNGLFNGSDTPLGGISVSLIWDLNGDGVWNTSEPIIATTTTASSLGANNSNYLFAGLPARNYLVHVSDTNAVLTNFIKSPLGATPGSDNNNQTDPYRVVLTPGGSNLTADFGYYLADRPNIAIIGNQVWMETDGNGLFEPTGSEIGQAGVTIELYKDGSYFDKTTTGASGDYSFPSLPGGTYSVTVADDFNVLINFSVSALGPNPGSEDNNQAQPYTIVLPSNGINLTADFGYKDGTGGGQGSAQIGNSVWSDVNNNGVLDSGEKAIGDVVVKLWFDQDNNCTLNTATDLLVGSRTTGSTLAIGNTNYLFEYPNGIRSGNYLVEVTDPNSQLVGATKSTAQTAGADNNSQTTPYCIQNFNPTGAGDVNLTGDFGYLLPQSRFSLTKTVLTQSPLRPGETILFSIRITNTGSTWLMTLPLIDTYDKAYIGYLSSVPASVDNANDGTINWTDLLSGGSPLAPGASVQVLTTFVSVKDTGDLPSEQTVNTATVSGATSDPDGPGVAPTSLTPLPDQSSQDVVGIINPTAVLVVNSQVALGDNGALLAWETVSEANVAGFHLLRVNPDGSTSRLTDTSLPAQKPGQFEGASYSWVDSSVQVGQSYTYLLEIIGLDNTTQQVTLGQVGGVRLFLPLTSR